MAGSQLHLRVRRGGGPLGASEHARQIQVLAVDLERDEGHVDCRVVVPGVARRRLVVPNVPPRIRVERDDRCDEEVVAALRAPEPAIPRTAVAGAEIQQITGFFSLG